MISVKNVFDALASWMSGPLGCSDSELPPLPSLSQGGAGGAGGAAGTGEGAGGAGGSGTAGGAGGVGGKGGAGGSGAAGEAGSAGTGGEGAAGAGGKGGAGGSTGAGGAAGETGAGGVGGGKGGAGGAAGAGGEGGADGGAPVTSNILCTFIAKDAFLSDYAMRMKSIAPVTLNGDGFKGQMLFMATPPFPQKPKELDYQAKRQKEPATEWPNLAYWLDWSDLILPFAEDLTGHYELSVWLNGGKYYLSIVSLDTSKNGFAGSWILPMTYYDPKSEKIEPIEPDTNNEGYPALESPNPWEVSYDQGKGQVKHVKPYDLGPGTGDAWEELFVQCEKTP